MSQAFKDQDWTQLGLGYIVKQIYDKHKVIWWVKINVGKAMTKIKFIKQQNIIYLDDKHQLFFWHLHKNLAISLCTWAFNHPDDVFYFQNVSEINGIHVPFKIMIQTPFNCNPWSL
jgi:hypothetical protein